MHWTIPRDVLEQIDVHAREARPGECCGVLLGTTGAPGLPGTIAQARRAANLSADPNRFELDPQAHVAAIRETRGSALRVVGFYHSHPHSAPIPSARDLAESTDPDALHLIIGFEHDASEARAYRLRADGYEETILTIEE